MKDQKQVDIWARKLEGEELLAIEEADLATAVIESPEFADLIAADQRMHELLQAHFRISETSNDFLARCQQMAGEQFTVSNSVAEDTVAQTTHFGSTSATVSVGSRVPQVPQIDLTSGGKIAVANRIAARRGKPRILGPMLAYSVVAVILIAFAGWVIRNQLTGPTRPGLNQGQPIAKSTPRNSLNPGPSESSAELKPSFQEGKLATSEPDQLLTSDSKVDARDGHSLTARSERDDVDKVASEKMPEQPLSADGKSNPVGRIRTSDDCEWAVVPNDFEAFPRRFDLKKGIAEIRFPQGPVVTMLGPANLCWEARDRISIDQGDLQFELPSDVSKISLIAPNVRLTPNGGSRMFLAVQPRESTNVEVAAGNITAAPWDRAETIVLAADGLNRGSFSPPWTSASKLPATAIAVSDVGQVHGIVDVADRPLTITEPEVLAQVLETSQEGLQKKPEQFPKDWQQMVEQVNGVTSGEMSLNGETQTIQSPQDFLTKMQQMQGRMQGAGASSTGGFSGAININGEERRFDSPEEFAKAQEQIFGPLFSEMFQNKPALKKKQTDSRNGKERTPEPMGNMNSNSVFSGMININGNAQTFSRQEDFERAMRDFRRKR